MTKISLGTKLLFIFTFVGLIACDSDFTDLNSSIIADDIHHNNIEPVRFPIVAYDRATGAVQSNNLPLNLLGIFDDGDIDNTGTPNTFGTTKAHFVSQVELATVNPTIGTNPVIDSVYIYVPYYSNVTGSDGSTGETFYDITSYFGNPNAGMKLHIKENRYFLRSSDPATGTAQKYYSDQKTDFDGVNIGPDLNDKPGVPIQNTAFTFSEAEIQRTAVAAGETEPVVVERFAPGLYAELNKAFFQDKLFSNQGRANMVSNNLFREYFRGLYFTVERNNMQPPGMAYVRFGEGRIVVRYHEDDNNGDTEDEIKSLTINLKGNTVNLFEKENPQLGYENALTNTNTATGDDRLYLKGGQGSMAIIKLDEAALNNLKPVNNNGENILINEANIVFNIDTDKIPAAKKAQPLRVYLYDIKNKRPLYDYFVDVSTNTTDQRKNKGVHGGIREEDKGIYRIRITNYVNQLVNKDSIHRPLGLVITENINLISNAQLKTPFTAEGVDVKHVPAASVFTPVGTVLHGSTSDVPEKRPQLEIFYTKPD